MMYIHVLNRGLAVVCNTVDELLIHLKMASYVDQSNYG